MSDVGVVMLLSESGGALFKGGRDEPDRMAAPSAQQVVAVLGAVAQTVKDFAILSALGFGNPLVGEGVQDAVNGRQCDPGRTLLTYLDVELLGATENVAAAQHVEDSLAVDGGSTSCSCG
jgi:hypothetical protein